MPRRNAAGRRRTQILLVTLVVAVAYLAFLSLPGVFEPLRHQATDRLFRLRSKLGLAPTYDETIVHVTIEDRTRNQSAGFYIGRSEMAQVIANLDAAGIAGQFHDTIYATRQDRRADAALISATEQARRVYFGMAAGLAGAAGLPAVEESAFADLPALGATRWYPEAAAGKELPVVRRLFSTFDELAASSRGIGYLDVDVDRDGIYRRHPLLARAGRGWIPSLALRVIVDFLEVDPAAIRVRAGHSIVLPDALRPGAATREDIVIPIDGQGRMVINWIGPHGTMTNYPFETIYSASDDRFFMMDLHDELTGKLAVVSWIATGSTDIGPVPVSPQYPLSGLHATVMHTILTGTFLREAGPWSMLLFVHLPLLGLLLVAIRRLPTLIFVLVPPILAALYLVSATLLFFYRGWILDLPGPVLTLAGATLVVSAWRYHCESQDRAVIRSTFEAYFPPAVVAKIMQNSEALTRTAQKKELTILFSDIRSFTGHTEHLEAGHVRDLLNEYFEKMIDIVFRHEGTLDKFIGDGLMVFFGDPQPQPDHATRCVRAAIEMQQATRELAAAWEKRGEMPLQIRIGINTGQVIVGNMGSSRRLSYTVLGEPVNLAQRLEANAPPGGILISARTRELLDDSVAVRSLESIRVKGFDTPITVFEVGPTPGVEGTPRGG